MPVPDTSVPVPQGMMLMSLCCMELQLDQWLLTKGRSASGRSAVSCGGAFRALSGQQAGACGEPNLRICSGHMFWVGLSRVSAEKC